MATAARGANPVGVRELARRGRDTNRWIGRQILEVRLEAGVSQAQLARCAGLAQSYLWRIEHGAANPSINALAAVSACLGCDLGVRLYPTPGPRLHDRFQAPMVEALIGSTGNGWRSHPEVPVAAARGVVDLILRRADDHLTVVCECQSELRRLELAIRRLGEKGEAVAATDPPGSTVSRLLLLRSTVATRSVARAYQATLTAAFPGRVTEALAALRGPDAPWPGPTLLWVTLGSGRARILGRPPRGISIGR